MYGIIIRIIVIAPGIIIQYYCEYERMVLVLLLCFCSDSSPIKLLDVMGELQFPHIHVFEGVFCGLGTQENIYSIVVIVSSFLL